MGTVNAGGPANGRSLRTGLAAPTALITLTALATVGVACGGAQTQATTPAASAGSEQSVPVPELPQVEQDEPAKEAVPRVVVEAVLEAGLGRLFQQVQVEPARQDGRFIGHRIVALDPAWKGGPVQVDDVVMRLNGSSLETPDKAQQAFSTLKVASEIVVEVLRDGKAIRTRLVIE